MSGQRVAIVEDHGLIAHTLATALRRGGVDAQILPIPEDGELAEAVTTDRPDLLLLDLDLGAFGDATRVIAPVTSAGCAVVMLTGVEDRVRHARCVAEGAVGVLSKSAGFDELFAAVKRALTDGTLLTEHERQEYLALLREHEREEQRRLGPFDELSRREAEVLGELMVGRSVEQVAEAAFVSVTTVRAQVRAILTKLGASSQVAAIGRARDAGWVPPQERDDAS